MFHVKHYKIIIGLRDLLYLYIICNCYTKIEKLYEKILLIFYVSRETLCGTIKTKVL